MLAHTPGDTMVSVYPYSVLPLWVGTVLHSLQFTTLDYALLHFSTQFWESLTLGVSSPFRYTLQYTEQPSSGIWNLELTNQPYKNSYIHFYACICIKHFFNKHVCIQQNNKHYCYEQFSRVEKARNFNFMNSNQIFFEEKWNKIPI